MGSAIEVAEAAEWIARLLPLAPSADRIQSAFGDLPATEMHPKHSIVIIYI